MKVTRRDIEVAIMEAVRRQPECSDLTGVEITADGGGRWHVERLWNATNAGAQRVVKDVADRLAKEYELAPEA